MNQKFSYFSTVQSDFIAHPLLQSPHTEPERKEGTIRVPRYDTLADCLQYCVVYMPLYLPVVARMTLTPGEC